MAIEPLGSIMTAQAQGSAQAKPVPKTESTPETTVRTAQEAPVVDKTTVVVEGAKDKGESNNKEAQAQSEQQKEQIRKAVEELNKKAKNSSAIFGIHEETNRVTIKIVDKETKEVIKEYPPEETLDMIAKAWEIAGILVDEKR